MENFSKYFPCARRALLSTISFWGYVLVRKFLYAFVLIWFDNEETRLFGYPEIAFTLQAVLGCAVALFVFYDCWLCDYQKEKEFVEQNENTASFSFVGELKTLIKNPEFLTGQGVVLFWCLCVSSVSTIPVFAFSVIAELWAHRNWFKTKSLFGKKKKKKGFYAFYLVLHIGIWSFIFFGLTLIVAMLKMGFTPIIEALKNYIIIIVSAFIILLLLVFLLSHLRAIKVQYKTIKKLKTLAKENRIKLKLPKHPYISLLRQRAEPFSLEHRHFSVNGVIIPTILRKTPLYFLGNGIVQRCRNYYFFKIKLFTKSKFLKYDFPESKRNEKKIILLSPIPREFFLANRDYSSDYQATQIDNVHILKNGPLPRTYFELSEGNVADGDNGSLVDGALIYSGTAFCNYIRRMCDN